MSKYNFEIKKVSKDFNKDELIAMIKKAGGEE